MAKKPVLSVYTRYSALGIQFTVAILAFTYAGHWVGTKFQCESWGTAIGAGLGFLGGTLYLYYEIYPDDRNPRSSSDSDLDAQ